MADARKDISATEDSTSQITRGCWIDLFDATSFKGKLRRIFGPAVYLNLRTTDPQTSVRFASLIVGPTAYVQLFAQRRPERGSTWLMPRQKLADLAAIKSDLELDSIRVLNRPPFQYEPGYSGFVRQMGRPGSEGSHRRKRRGRK
jgi:hypothetical protein